MGIALMAASAAPPVSSAAPSAASSAASPAVTPGARRRSRRRGTLRLAAGLAALAVLAGACGSGDGDETTTDEPSEGAAAPSENGGDAAFPVEIEHEYGSTTSEELPERVVTVGLTDQDAVLALGVVPVGITDWFGDHPHGVWPWAQDLLGGVEPEVLSSEQGIDAEAIAALEPDVILALYAGLTDDEYDTLSEIAHRRPAGRPSRLGHPVAGADAHHRA